MNNLKNYRTKHGMTQEEMAMKLHGISKAAVSFAEKHSMSVNMARECADILEENVFSILGRDALKAIPTTPEEKRELLMTVMDIPVEYEDETVEEFVARNSKESEEAKAIDCNFDGLLLNGLRRYKGFTSQEVAEKCGLSQAYISNVESGRWIAPRKTFKEILNALGFEIRVVEKENPEAGHLTLADLI